MKTAFHLIVLLALAVATAGCRSTGADCRRSCWSASEIKSFCIREVTVAEVEKGRHPGMPVPEASAGWSNFKRQVVPGDHIWYFCAPQSAAKKANGWRGYALYRDAHLIATFTVADE